MRSPKTPAQVAFVIGHEKSVWFLLSGRAAQKWHEEPAGMPPRIPQSESVLWLASQFKMDSQQMKEARGMCYGDKRRTLEVSSVTYVA